MNFKIGSYVEWKHVKGYIRFVSEEYITICVNVHKDSSNLDCCVLCYPSYWKEVVVHKEVPPIFPIMMPL